MNSSPKVKKPLLSSAVETAVSSPLSPTHTQKKTPKINSKFKRNEQQKHHEQQKVHQQEKKPTKKKEKKRENAVDNR